MEWLDLSLWIVNSLLERDCFKVSLRLRSVTNQTRLYDCNFYFNVCKFSTSFSSVTRLYDIVAVLSRFTFALSNVHATNRFSSV